MTDEHDTDWVQASKAAAADLADMILRNKKAMEAADWRERKCGECGYTNPRTGLCRRYDRQTLGNDPVWWFTGHEDPACPDFVPREVTP